ncbi:MAG: PAS domain-containing protein [Alistipes sp.]|nr:PAS domain-containing protein [Alistipes sp.]
MFKSVKYRLTIYAVSVVVSTAAMTWLFVAGRSFWGVLAGCVLVFALRGMMRSYEKLNSNFIFLLNALENGDYSFNLSETGMTRREQEFNGILNAIKEILVRARREEIENEKFLSLIVAAVPVGIVIVDERDFVRVANDAALRLLGMHVFTHIRQLAMIDEAVMQAFVELAPGSKTTVRIADEREERLISLGMSRIEVGKGVLRVVSMHNIAGELEEREMESWIKLIRVMTHEIMNSIAPITSLSETMLYSWGDETSDEERLRRNTVDAFETITATARGLLSFVESYRRFTGIPKPELRPVEIGAVVERIVNLEKPAFDRRDIRVVTRLGNPALTVAADEGQIAQVLVNLLKNAAEAIAPERTDGLIEVRIVAAEGQVRLEVANNGEPIPDDVLPHIFVPFFTTKDSGTGIGLSVSRYIMRLHGGNLKHRVDGGRTVFSMVFPASV